MTDSNTVLAALYDALDAQRRSRGMTWSAVAREINHFKTAGHPVASSTITGLKNKAVAEGDGVLQMLLWLRRTPESFIPGVDGADAENFRLPDVEQHQTLRWDTKALHTALNSRREAGAMTWVEVARQVGGFTPGMLTNLAKGGRIGFPNVIRIVRWLGQPAASFTRVSNW